MLISSIIVIINIIYGYFLYKNAQTELKPFKIAICSSYRFVATLW